MGVHGLWKLVEQAGKPVPLETLENKVLVIDISIWLHQVVKGIQDGRGNALHNAHLIGLFNRLCKLMYYKIKPVFVFDGGVPLLKRQTIAKRQQSKNKLQTDASRIEQKLLETLAKEKIVQQALGGSVDALISPSKLRPVREQPDRDEIFKLPKLENPLDHTLNHNQLDDSDDEETATNIQEDVKNFYLSNLQNIDVTSSYFKSLPADIRHNILYDMKEARKQSSWGRLHEMPTESNNFSEFQMKRLLKRRKVQESLEEAENEMGGKSLSFGELEQLMAEDGIIDPKEVKKGTKIASDENTRFLLVKDMKKALEQAKLPKPEIPSTSAEEPMETEDMDLQMAIALSLQDDPANLTQVDVKSTKEIRLSTPQRETLKTGAKASAKSYMQEYGILTTDEITDLFTKKSPHKSVSKDNEIIDDKLNTSPLPQPAENETNNELIELDSDSSSSALLNKTSPRAVETDFPINDKSSLSSDNDSDFVDVPNADDLDCSFIHPNNYAYPMPEGDPSKEVRLEDIKPLEVVIDPTKALINDDLFADIFDTKPPKSTIKGSNNQSKESFEEKFVIAKPTDLKRKTSAAKNILEKLNKEKDAILSIGLDEILSQETEPLSSEFKSAESKASKVEEVSLNKSKSFETILEPYESPTKGTLEAFVLTTTPKKEKKPAETQPEYRTPKKTAQEIPREVGLTPEKIRNLELRAQIEEQANDLKNSVTSEELSDMKSKLANEHRLLEKEMNKMDRQGLSISDRMINECQFLLKLFGVPYVTAKAEAEAQCAFFNEVGLVDGIITDDSDVWLFGGKVVYKNFFDHNKTVLEFRRENIENVYTMDRRKLIQMALLVGSDYTTGISGVGPVTALEILAAFPFTHSELGTNEIMSVLSSLRKFRDWFTNGKNSTTKEFIDLKQKLRGIALIEGFPSPAVVEAYLHPAIDDSTEPFTWGTPDVDGIKDFAKRKLGWTELKMNEVLGPVLKRLAEKQSQKSIKNYFKLQNISKPNEVQASKRVKRALNRLAGIVEEEAEEKPAKRKKIVKKSPATKDKNSEKFIDLDKVELSDSSTDGATFTSISLDNAASTSTKIISERVKEASKTNKKEKVENGQSAAATKIKKASNAKQASDTKRTRKAKSDAEKPPDSKASSSSTVKIPCIPNPNAPIPQRVKDLKDQEEAKKRAAAILKAKNNLKK